MEQAVPQKPGFSSFGGSWPRNLFALLALVSIKSLNMLSCMLPPKNHILSNNGQLPKGTPYMNLSSKVNETSNVACVDFHGQLEEGRTPCPTCRPEKKGWLWRALSKGRAQCPKAGSSHFLPGFPPSGDVTPCLLISHLGNKLIFSPILWAWHLEAPHSH